MSFPESLKQDFDVLDGGPTGRILPCYRVRERKPFGREFMLRLLPDEYCGDKGLVDAFHEFFTRFSEISNKTYLASVHSVVGAVNRSVYVLEEFVSGVTLNEFLEKRKGSNDLFQDAINIISRVCEALHSAHQKDIFHLCVSPEDILIGENNPGKVKLVGFGAQLFASKGKLDYLSSESKTYIAPEVFKRGVFGPKADVYSLAVTIKELLPEFSEASDILVKATSVTLKDRFPNARQFAAKIKERALSDPVAEPTPKVSKPTKAAKLKGGLQPILKVRTDPPGAIVIVDGKVMGTTTSSGFAFPWSPGKAISFEKLGYETKTLSLNEPPENSTIEIKLNPALKLFTNPWGATIRINGDLVGTTTHNGLMLPWDKGEIVIEKSGYKTKKLSFAAPPTEPELIVELEIAEETASANHVPNRTISFSDSKPVISKSSIPENNLLKVITLPIWAYVRVNGRLIGVSTESGLDVPREKGEILIEKIGYKTKRLKFYVPPSEPYLVIELEPQSVPVSHSLPEKPSSTGYAQPETSGTHATTKTVMPESNTLGTNPPRTLWKSFRWMEPLAYRGATVAVVLVLVASFIYMLNLSLTNKPSNPTKDKGQFHAAQSSIPRNVDMELISAAANANDSRIRRLLAQGADPNARDRNNDHTALMEACIAGSLEVVKTLLEFGAYRDLKSSQGLTALDFAKKHNHTNIISLLNTQSPSTKRYDSSLNEALIMACAADNHQEVRGLLAQGANVNLRTYSLLRTPLMVAIDNNNAEVVKVLLEAGADQTVKDVTGRSAQDYAKGLNNPMILELLRKHK
jgi:serine/threonine protein kinase